MGAERQSGRPERAAHGIDRMIRNVETGRFERGLSALTAAGALVTAAEIFFEHDSASFGNKMMWGPVALGPVGAVAGVAGVFCPRAAKTARPPPPPPGRPHPPPGGYPPAPPLPPNPPARPHHP